ncbi:MAG: 50S ribosomal protein L14e [DPANN group archaeon]|nr:50S ribosomal protein L14e [DPANN group archaeon]
MFEIGRLCMKIAGRDSKRYCVIVDVLENNYVLVDGGVRRRKVNSLHLTPTKQKIDLKKGASHDEVKKAFEKLGHLVWETKPKQAGPRPRKVKKKKEAPEKNPKKARKAKVSGTEGKPKQAARPKEEKAKPEAAPKEEAKPAPNLAKNPAPKKE